MPSWQYKFTTGNFVTNKTLFTTFQKSHWLMFARCWCNAESRCLSTTDFQRRSITILHDKQNISPSSTWKVPVGYFLAWSWAVTLSGRWELAFLVEETAGLFITNLPMSKFLSVFNERNHILLKSWQLRLFFTSIFETNISHSNWLIWTKGMFVLHQ